MPHRDSHVLLSTQNIFRLRNKKLAFNYHNKHVDSCIHCTPHAVLFDLILYIQVNNFSDISGQVLMG